MQSPQPTMDAVPISKKLIAFGSKKIYLYAAHSFPRSMYIH